VIALPRAFNAVKTALAASSIQLG